MKSKSRFSIVKKESSDTGNQSALSHHVPVDEDLDYMADDYIKAAKAMESNSKSASKRPIGTEAAVSIPSKRQVLQVMEEKLIEGVNTTISTESKGFKLLQKFGYTEGGLGKDKSGIANPIPIAVRIGEQNRSGIGLEHEKKRKTDKFNDDIQKIAVLRESMVNDYQARLTYENEVKRARKYVYGAEKIIYEYDTRENIDKHHLWPRHVLKELTSPGDDEDDDESNDDKEIVAELNDQEIFQRLQECLIYVREKYCYCYFCGCRYDDADDLVMNCPGLLYNDH
jgi:hypothetical protein